MFVANKLSKKHLYSFGSALIGASAGWYSVRLLTPPPLVDNLQGRLDEALRSNESGSTFKLWGISSS
jgi:hypothetical protein